MHKKALQDRWQKFSVEEQMGNIWSEVGRAARWQGENEELFQGAAERALELFDLTMKDPKWRNQGRLREIARARELFCHALYSSREYHTSLADLENYFYPFVFAARRNF